MMNNLNLLLIENETDGIEDLKQVLSGGCTPSFQLKSCRRLEEGIACASGGDFDVVLFDISLPDGQGLHALEKFIEKVPDLPVIALMGKDDSVFGKKAVEVGAQDYLGKEQFDHQLLSRSVSYSLERHRLLRELKAARMAERFLAHRDNLTELPNRRLFYDRLQQSILHAKRYGHLFAILFLDLDGFKTVNDKLGHGTGDLLLQKAAERLRSCVRQSDTVARWGGDEFTIILNRIANDQDAITVAQKILDSISEPFIINEHELFVSTSIGISLYPSDGTDQEQLLKKADTAMYRAKQDGKNGFRCYNVSMDVGYFEQLIEINNLRQALEADELEPYYQPQIDLATGEIVGVEAFVRWHHPKLGLIPPSKFMSLAIQTGLILQIDDWMLRKVCEQNKEWQESGYGAIRVSVNLSERTFREPKLPSILSRTIKETGVNANDLVLEITENGSMEEIDKTVSRLQEFKDLGVKIALHQFGTGKSSLSCLKSLPKDILKIDRSFVNGIPDNEEDMTITKGIAALAHSLDLKVIAEGVETQEQLSFFLHPGCDEVQGYYICQPLSADSFTSLLRTGWHLNGKRTNSDVEKVSPVVVESDEKQATE
ncbi:MAG: EAL domain-containing protein [bacterium]